jgi:hypothetical protein
MKAGREGRLRASWNEEVKKGLVRRGGCGAREGGEGAMERIKSGLLLSLLHRSLRRFGVLASLSPQEYII